MVRLSLLQDSEYEDGISPAQGHTESEKEKADAREAQEFRDSLAARGKLGPHRVIGENIHEWVRSLFTPFDSRDSDNRD